MPLSAHARACETEVINAVPWQWIWDATAARPASAAISSTWLPRGAISSSSERVVANARFSRGTNGREPGCAAACAFEEALPAAPSKAKRLSKPKFFRVPIRGNEAGENGGFVIAASFEAPITLIYWE